MKKRQLILNDYRTAEDGLFTLSACKITKAAQEQTFVKVPGRFAPLDLSTVLTDGQPYYGNAKLDAVLESSEGTREERQKRIEYMKNLLDGHCVKIIHPDFPEHYLIGRVQVSLDFNGLAYCSVSISAVLEPWLYSNEETTKEALLPYAEVLKVGGMTYKDGEELKSAPVTAVESAGKNIWKNESSIFSHTSATQRTDTGFIFTREGHTGGAAVYYSIPLKKGQTVTFSCVGNPYTPMLYLYKERAYGTNLMSVNSGKLTYTAQEDLPKATFTVIINSTEPSVEVSNIQVELKDTVTSYSPYFRSTLPIPAEVQALDGYGWGVNASVYNYIDWEKKQFVQNVGKVDLGTLSWAQNVTSQFYATLPTHTKTAAVTNHLCARYETSAAGAYNNAGNKVISLASLNHVWVVDKDFTASSALKTSLAGEMLYYELPEPIITDLSGILPDDNLLAAEEGGTITFKNTHGFEVPNEMTIRIDSAVQGPQEIVLTNEGRMAVIPTLVVDGVVSLTYGGKTHTLSTGAYQVTDLYLPTGEHRVLLLGKGTVTITYREAVLAG